MMTREDATRIAETLIALRPDWQRNSIVTLLAEYRHRDPRDVHLAAIWIAYDPDTRTPARLREDGPWWHLTDHSGPPRLTAWRDPHADITPATPDAIRRIRAARKATA